ncbi:Holliday junction resolvase RuvX [Psychrosphaera sp. B3R10]|uniref:Holliday junction resolvase RuvX n=1 Tax=unclassified Psychrosphaera TaxID=2641570 RepID=UPI001C09B650|nr:MULTISPECIES: Holliday junction resolvase RuvX [unclassified Psychrosphaera]MBU2880894.1 Holliday junction resolvase RuvX [Psychrosphaera sp. I2R16]MBU2990887.1 Holliday junction resolvase RuvX [Psychrosphaera sp. B3R10]
MKSKTIIGIDYGTTSIGFAVGQSLTGTASPLEALRAKDGVPQWDQVEKLLTTWEPDLVVVGLPLNMDGTEQPMTARAKKFANKIHGRFGYAIVTHDERLTTVDAKADLFASGGFRNLKKGNVDSQSAVVILESYFENCY